MIKVSDWTQNTNWLDDPNADIDTYCGSIKEDLEFSLLDKLTHWQEKGFVILEGVVDNNLIDELLADVRFIKKYRYGYELGVEYRGQQGNLEDFSEKELNDSGIKFNSIHNISRAAEQLNLTKSVCDFLRHVFKDSPVLLQSLTFLKGSQQPAHIDYPYVRIQSIINHLAASWIPLEDIHPESGPLQYYPGSHKIETSDFFDWGGGSIVLEPDSSKTPQEFSDYLINRMTEKNIEPLVFCPKRGDALIWSGSLVHGGSQIMDNKLTRKSYVTHYTSLEGYPETRMKENAIEDNAF